MLKTVLLIGLLLIVALLIVAATRPGTFQVQRSISVKAPPEVLFAHVNDFNRWGAWSPWERKDPAMKRAISNDAGGVGAVYAWEGNSSVGSGRMEILESLPPEKIVIQLDFVKPFRVRNITEFTLESSGDTTEVSWSMHGPMPFLSKLIGLFIDMDRMIGSDFETGLHNLRMIAEKQVHANRTVSKETI